MSDPQDIARRSFVLSVAATVAVSTSKASALVPAAQSAMTPDADGAQLAALPAVDAVARMSRGELSAERYAGALLGRCAAGRALNAFITLEPERVLEAARACDQARRAGRRPGPLFGLPIPIKDSVNTLEYPTTAGTPALRHFHPAQDAPVVGALRAAGAIVLGKTNLHELSYGWTSNNLAFGAVHNPYDPACIPGGSSGGTAAAIAARMAPLGVAEDTEGSIRVPAAMCGIVGLRPTTGRYSTRGCVPVTPLFDQLGPHARTVADLALFDSVICDDWKPLRPAALRGTRLGVVRDYWYSDLDPEVERITSTALKRLEEAGVVLVEAELPGLAHLIDLVTGPIQNHDTRPALTRYLEEYRTGITFEQLVSEASPDIRAIFRRDVLPGGANFVTDAEYAAILSTHLPALHRLYGEFFARAHVVANVFPATMVPALPIGSEQEITIGGRRVSFDTAVARNIDPGSTTGLPGLVLPAGLTSSGLPVALELDAPAGADRDLLALGMSLAQVLGPLPPPRL